MRAGTNGSYLQSDGSEKGSLLLRETQRIEKWGTLDGLDGAMNTVGEAMNTPILRGQWLGHALHPVLTDLPLGCWIGAALLDITGGRARRPGAQRLVGLGVAAALPTAATGLAEWESLPNRAARRVATVHAVGNTVVLLLYLRSWLSRRAGRHAAGVVWGMAGGVLATVTGYLGGHLSFGLGAGVGERGGHPSFRDAATGG